MFFVRFLCSRRPKRGLESFLAALRFILTEFQLVGSHGDPIRDILTHFRHHKMCDFDPKKTTCSIWTHKLNDDVQNDHLGIKHLIFGAPTAPRFMGAPFFFAGKFRAKTCVVEKQDIALVETQGIALVETLMKVVLSGWYYPASGASDCKLNFA